MEEILKQECDFRIIQTKKTIEWLINNTKVRTFNKITLEGYQREITENHVNGIVKYLLKSDFYMPTSIICACDNKYDNDSKLFVVDGQHRIKAFEKIKEINNEQYEKIKYFEISVVILEKPELEREIDTFITINKTAKKVDTSLALILKNKIARKNIEDIDKITKKEFIAVELAVDLREDENDIWNERIKLEGNLKKKSYETISLNSFVRATRSLISYLEKYQIIDLSWKDEKELSILKEKVKDIYIKIWEKIKDKWPLLFREEYRDSVIQKTIGVTSLTKYIILQMQTNEVGSIDKDNFISNVQQWINGINYSEKIWYEEFSKYSSESGFTLVAQMLFEHYKK